MFPCSFTQPTCLCSAPVLFHTYSFTQPVFFHVLLPCWTSCTCSFTRRPRRVLNLQRSKKSNLLSVDSTLSSHTTLPILYVLTRVLQSKVNMNTLVFKSKVWSQLSIFEEKKKLVRTAGNCLSNNTHRDASASVMEEMEETKRSEQNKIDINMKRHLMPRPTIENHADTDAVECRMQQVVRKARRGRKEKAKEGDR